MKAVMLMSQKNSGAGKFGPPDHHRGLYSQSRDVAPAITVHAAKALVGVQWYRVLAAGAQIGEAATSWLLATVERLAGLETAILAPGTQSLGFVSDAPAEFGGSFGSLKMHWRVSLDGVHLG